MKPRFSVPTISAPNLIHLLNILLVSVLAIFMAYWSWQIWLLSTPAEDATPEVAAETIVSPSFQPSAAGLRTHWFDGGADDKGPSKSPSSLRLIGLFSASDGRPSHAMISANGAAAQTLPVGARLASGEKVEKIYPDHLVLSRDGVTERLDLDRKPDVQGLILPLNKTSR